MNDAVPMAIPADDTPAPASPPRGPVAPTTHERVWLWIAAVIVLLGGAGGGTLWWLTRPASLPSGLASSNGRIEPNEIEISTRFAGRFSTILVDRGDPAGR